MLDIREIPFHARRLPFFVFLFIIFQTLRIVALLPIVLELEVMLSNFDFCALMAGAGSLDEGSAPPVGRGSPEAMPTVPKRDGGRRLFDAAVVLGAVGIFTGGTLLSDDAVGFNNLDLRVPLDGFIVCAGWEGMYVSTGERGGSVAFVRRPRTLVSLPFIPSVGCAPSSGLQNILALRSAGISPGGGRRTPVSIGLWIGAGGTVGATCSSALLPADDELALDREVVLSCTLDRFTMRSACTGAAGTDATSACEILGGVTVGAEGEGIGDKGADAFSDSETSSPDAATMRGRREGDDNFIPGDRLLRLVVNLTAAGGAFATTGGDSCGVGLDPDCGAGESATSASVAPAFFSLIRLARASIISSSACMSKSSVSITKASPPKNETLSFRRSKDASGQFSWRLNEEWRSTEFRRELNDGEDVVCARARKRRRAVGAVNVSYEGDDWV